MLNDEITTRFTYHVPEPDQIAKFAEIRLKAREFANMLNGFCPESREKSLAVTALEEAVMWANASIVRRK